MNIKLDRRDVCKVLLALTAVSFSEGASPEYKRVHDEIKEQLREYDNKTQMKEIEKKEGRQ